MDDSQEPSYYEIALTNRQVLIFFVVLLVCVVGAFFSGIWLGQQRAVTRPSVAEAAIEEPIPITDDESLAELNFFTDEESASSAEPARKAAASEKQSRESRTAPKRSEPVAAAGSPDTTLLEDLDGSREAEPPTPAREPVSKPREAVSEPEPASPSPAASSTAGGFVIQVFSSPDGDQARKVLDRLTSGGYAAFISPVEVDGRVMHRVRVGPFSEKDAAEGVASRVKVAYQLDTWVTAND